MFELMTSAAGASSHYYQWLSREEHVTCLASEKTYQPWPKPNLVIADVCFIILPYITLMFVFETLADVRMCLSYF